MICCKCVHLIVTIRNKTVSVYEVELSGCRCGLKCCSKPITSQAPDHMMLNDLHKTAEIDLLKRTLISLRGFCIECNEQTFIERVFTLGDRAVSFRVHQTTSLSKY